MHNFNLVKIKSCLSQDEEAFSFRKTTLRNEKGKYEPYVKKYDEVYSKRLQYNNLWFNQ